MMNVVRGSSVLLFIFVLTASVTASKSWVYVGGLGNHLNCRIDFEPEPKVGVDTNITFIFTTDDVYNVHIDYLTFSIDGGGITFPGPSTVDEEIIAKNMSVNKGSSLNATYKIKPTEEGLILCTLHAYYTAINAFHPNETSSEWSQQMIYIGYARTLTHGELWLLLYIFIGITIMLVVTDVIYLKKKRKKH